ncbi:MAG: mucoidy inhibitor MuiA family protein [Steroidobacteraceae bacterium]
MTLTPATGAKVLMGGLAVSLCSAVAAGADISADLHVDRVTVYQKGAIVTRAGTIDVPAGTNRLLIEGLPAAIEPKSLHVAVENAAVRLGGVEVEQINEGKFVSAAERDLRRKLEQKTDQRAAVQDDVATAQLQLKLLDSLAANPTGSPTKATVDSANLSAVLATMATNSAFDRKRIRDSNVQMRELDREIEKLKSDLAKVATQSKQSTDIHAALEAKAASTTTVTVTYKITNASWQWIYAARLDTTKKRITLERQGQVQQGSGEDWKNVELTLTTTLPSDDVATPLVGSLFVNLEEPRLQRDVFAQQGQLRAAAMSAPSAAPPSEEALPTNRKSARVEATDYLADYKIPDRATLLADREPRLYPIADDAFDVDLVARVVPSAGRAAHLEATFKYQRDVPLESGQLQLYRDGAYVGEAMTKAFLPGAPVRMPFGTDERIRVVVQDEPSQSAEHGILSKQAVKETRRRFDVTSYHPSPIVVEVMDRIPVSKHADVRVEVLKGATEPTVKDADGRAGVLLWRFDAQPQKTVSIRQYYSIQYPKDRHITESEGETSD